MRIGGGIRGYASRCPAVALDDEKRKWGLYSIAVLYDGANGVVGQTPLQG